MDRTEESLERLIGQTFARTPDEALVYLHTYDYAIPSGVSVFRRDAAWLKPALVDARVPASLHRDCIRFLIDRFADRLERLARRHAGRVSLVDSRGTLAPGGWANELHPKPSGFRKIAEECWAPLLRRDGLAL